MKTISDIFKEIDETLTNQTVSIGDLVEHLHERGFGFLLLILSIPMALPIPVPPGINILLASPLILLTAQQAIGYHSIWLPNWIKQKGIKRESMSAIIQKTLPWFKKLEKIIKPRLEFLTRGISSNIIGVLGLIMALTICVPLPMTNTVPSLGIALMAIGLINRDGLAVLAGAVIGFAWVCALTMIIVFLGTEGIDIIKDVIKGSLGA
ncbi:MAG: exopolysaccharide biosynthesis protein [Alphaproteobacteria bacterium]